MRIQAKDPVIHDLIQWYGTKELHKSRDKDSPEMKQFLCQRGKLIIRNGILYHKNNTKESECPNWNTMQLVLLTALRFILHYGLPKKNLTDQGHNFESDLLKALCEVAQVKKIRTLGYHPQTNG